MNCSHCHHEDSKIIFKSNCWTIVFHKQDYLGRCVLDLNRHVDSFSKLTDAEIIDLRNVLAALEKELKALYGCTMLNWCCNMNNAYSRQDETPHVHIHVRPRYKNVAKIGNTTYQDKEFGAHYDRKAPVQFSPEEVQLIYQQMKENFKKYV